MCVGQVTKIKEKQGDGAWISLTALSCVCSTLLCACRLTDLVEAPSVVREVDWLDHCWPKDAAGERSRPKIQKYCLMSMQGSYTDFHIDFGGSSVWYHVLWVSVLYWSTLIHFAALRVDVDSAKCMYMHRSWCVYSHQFPSPFKITVCVHFFVCFVLPCYSVTWTSWHTSSSRFS